jgi:hypothetical protein
VLREHEKGLLIRTVRPGAPRETLLTPVLQSRVDGAFVLLSGEPELRRWYIDRLGDLGSPFVVIDGSAPMPRQVVLPVALQVRGSA